MLLFLFVYIAPHAPWDEKEKKGSNSYERKGQRELYLSHPSIDYVSLCKAYSIIRGVTIYPELTGLHVLL